uniref:Uncharacterized protein n=1 Tax=Arundo donax TaxID=35708 RepID=A0A0A9G0W5_ARUDO
MLNGSGTGRFPLGTHLIAPSLCLPLQFNQTTQVVMKS